VQAVVAGNRDPGYLETSRMVLEAALCLALQGAELKEKGMMQGGVLTPACSMGSVLTKRLRDADITFEITKTGKEAPKGPLDKLKAASQLPASAPRTGGAMSLTPTSWGLREHSHTGPLATVAAAGRRLSRRARHSRPLAAFMHAAPQHAHPLLRVVHQTYRQRLQRLHVNVAKHNRMVAAFWRARCHVHGVVATLLEHAGRVQNPWEGPQAGPLRPQGAAVSLAMQAGVAAG
jgi:hypothetical protein